MRSDNEEIHMPTGREMLSAWRQHYRDGEAFRAEAETLLIHLASEYDGPWWRRLWSRWVYHHEPLRNDAARLVRRYGVIRMTQRGTHLVGDAAQESRQ